MIDLTTKQKVAQALKSSQFLSQLDLPDRKRTIWRVIKNTLQKHIQYAFDQECQHKTNDVLQEVDKILETKETPKLKSKAEQKLRKFPQILEKIVKDYQELEDEETEDLQNPEVREKLMDSVFTKEIQNWTFSQLRFIVEQKWEKLQKMKYRHMNDQEKCEYPACNKFRQLCKDLDLDWNLLDEIMIKRIGFKSVTDFDSSLTSHNQTESEVSLRSDICSEVEISTTSENAEVENSCSQTVEQILDCLHKQLDQKCVLYDESERKKEENRFIKKEKVFEAEIKQEVSTQSTQSCTQKQEPRAKVQQKSEQEQEEIRFGTLNQRLNQRNVINPEVREQRLPARFSTANLQNERTRVSNRSNNDSDLREEEESLLFRQSESILQEENNLLYQRYSSAMIERYTSQSRFPLTSQIYVRERRQREVDSIIQNQLRPLVSFLKKLTLKDIIEKSFSNQLVDQIQVYGSFENRCGFRKISDLNINIVVDNLPDWKIPNCLFHLRNRLDYYRKTGHLNSLNLRSVICSTEDKEVILSHINNADKKRDQNFVNYIFITINKKHHVLSSDFIKDVVYSGQDKALDIAHLMNFVHLLFKRNKILDHKDVYHSWFTTSPEERQSKNASRSRYVSISVYAMQMMVLFYLQQTKQITKIRYDEKKEKYDFNLIDQDINLYQRLVKFLEFYSFQGNYISDHANKHFIDVVNRSATQEAQVLQEIQKNSFKIVPKIDGHMFTFVHPAAIDLINGKDENYMSFELKRNSENCKLFLTKIDDLLERAKRFGPNRQWDPEILFDTSNEF